MSLHRCRSVFVLGGARSGKSRYAQTLAEASGRPLVYCATAARYGDREMDERIARHRTERDARWRTVEAPLALCDALTEAAVPDGITLVDCLTVWLGNVMLDGRDVEGEIAALGTAVAVLPGGLVFVSNEVGSGIVPDNALARRFRDAQGRLNQAMAAACDAAVLVVAGLPLLLKPRTEPTLTLAPGPGSPQVSTSPLLSPEPGEPARPCGSAR